MPIVVAPPLTPEKFAERVESIRRLVYIGYDKTDLLDAEITDDTRLGESNRKIARRVPNWADLQSTDRESLEVAVCKLTAAELLKSTARTIEVDRASARSRMIALSIEDTIAAYLEDVEDIINDVSPDDFLGATPYFNVINLQEDEDYQ